MALLPRAVVVTRPTELDGLLARHGTAAAAAFFLEQRGQTLEEARTQHEAQQRAVGLVLSSIPLDWRRARVERRDLDRFLFEPGDIVLCVGQDGLVANVAKYLRHQAVVGVNPAPDLYDGVLVRHDARQARALMERAAAGDGLEERTLACARTADGQRLVALNEIFVGHRSHQSARYRIELRGREERHSSSGLIACTGTGATGWARSICLTRDAQPPLPEPTERALSFFVREPFPSVRTQTALREGRIEAGRPIRIVSEMEEGGVVFGDGIETDHLDLPYGQVLDIGPDDLALQLLT